MDARRINKDESQREEYSNITEISYKSDGGDLYYATETTSNGSDYKEIKKTRSFYGFTITESSYTNDIKTSEFTISKNTEDWKAVEGYYVTYDNSGYEISRVKQEYDVVIGGKNEDGTITYSGKVTSYDNHGKVNETIAKSETYKDGEIVSTLSERYDNSGVKETILSGRYVYEHQYW